LYFTNCCENWEYNIACSAHWPVSYVSVVISINNSIVIYLGIWTICLHVSLTMTDCLYSDFQTPSELTLLVFVTVWRIKQSIHFITHV